MSYNFPSTVSFILTVNPFVVPAHCAQKMFLKQFVAGVQAFSSPIFNILFKA